MFAFTSVHATLICSSQCSLYFLNWCVFLVCCFLFADYLLSSIIHLFRFQSFSLKQQRARCWNKNRSRKIENKTNFTLPWRWMCLKEFFFLSLSLFCLSSLIFNSKHDLWQDEYLVLNHATGVLRQINLSFIPLFSKTNFLPTNGVKKVSKKSSIKKTNIHCWLFTQTDGNPILFVVIIRFLCFTSSVAVDEIAITFLFISPQIQ